MCKEAHDRFEYPWPVSRGVSVGGRGNNRKSDTDYRRYRDFSLVIATPFDTITRTITSIRCLYTSVVCGMTPLVLSCEREVRETVPQ